ncbi:hypothetical protein AVEN_61831-1 [Araneus ventricosus]|uniref:C2H2-type domain-containing protein n=1 Tax=Araneus ventricosus TaxID=182803 RepID=A0A4Y2LRH0_ARAVE|nr:hypothetical protein AVEN_61831-1 [Araneus ventricosus]
MSDPALREFASSLGPEVARTLMPGPPTSKPAFMPKTFSEMATSALTSGYHVKCGACQQPFSSDAVLAQHVVDTHSKGPSNPMVVLKANPRAKLLKSPPPGGSKVPQRKFILEKDGWKTIAPRKSPPPGKKVAIKVEVPSPITFVRPSESAPKLLSKIVKPDSPLKETKSSNSSAPPKDKTHPDSDSEIKQMKSADKKMVQAKASSAPSGSSQQPSTSTAPPTSELETRPPSKSPFTIETDGSLRCPFCELQLPNRKALRVHLLQIHKCQEK